MASDTFQERQAALAGGDRRRVAVKLAMAGGCGVGWTLTVAVAVEGFQPDCGR